MTSRLEVSDAAGIWARRQRFQCIGMEVRVWRVVAGRRWRRRGSAEEHERGRGQSEQLVGAWVGGGRGDALPLSPEALAVFRRGAHGRVVEWLNERIRECRHGRAQKRELQASLR